MVDMELIQAIEQNAAAQSFLGAFGGLALALLGAGLAAVPRHRLGQGHGHRGRGGHGPPLPGPQQVR